MRYITAAGVIALAGLGYSDVQAGVELRDVSGGTVTLLEPNDLDPGKYRATVDSGTNVSFTLRFDAEDIVEEIEIVPLNQSGAKVSVTVDGIESFTPPAFYGLQQIKRLVRGAGAGEVWITKVQANLIGDVERDLDIGVNPNPDYGKTSGLIRANRIGNVIAHWSVLADIEATGTALSNPDGDIIDLVEAELNAQWGPQFALDGAILGDLRSNGGRIGTIRAASFISAVNNEASSNTQVIDTNGGNIGLIEAGSLGEVTIDCLGSSSGTITTIRTLAGGWGYDEGRDVYLSDPIDFDDSNRPLGFSAGGALLAGDLNALELKGSLDSVVTIASEPQTGVWKIGDSLGPNALITLRNSGLTGQIAINANGGDGQWLGVIRVAETANVVGGPWFVLDEPEYDFNPGLFYNATLGQVGAAGLQSYALWDNACDPRPGGVRFRGSIDRNSIEENPPCIDNFTAMRIAFYGGIERVNNQDGWDEVVLLEKRQGALNQFSEVTEDFSVSPDAETRGIKLVRGGMAGAQWETGTYRITILPNKLRVRSAEVFAGEPQLPIASIQYEFSVVKGCEELDLNGDLLITYEDMVEWMIEPVNLNNLPTVDGADASTLQRGINEHGPEN